MTVRLATYPEWHAPGVNGVVVASSESPGIWTKSSGSDLMLYCLYVLPVIHSAISSGAFACTGLDCLPSCIHQNFTLLLICERVNCGSERTSR